MALSDGARDLSRLREHRERIPKMDVSPSTPPTEGVGRAWLREHAFDDVLVLPDDAERMGAVVFDETAPKVLHIGSAMRRIDKGTFYRSALESIEIAEDNPWLMTDGRAVYSADGSTLIALAVPVSSYTVLDGCTSIEGKAFFSMEQLEHVELPESLVEIGPYAFSQSGLVSCTMPAHLESIGNRVFFRCEELRDVSLNEGLRSIGEGAFASTRISCLHIPGSVDELGDDFAAGSHVDFAHTDTCLSIGEGSALSIDAHGGLYRELEDGVHFVRLLNGAASSYEVSAGTRVIDENAFRRHPDIRSVELPEGVEEIAASAFAGCAALRSVTIPSTMKVIGDEAFHDTSIESFFIPAGLESIGELALVTRAAAHGSMTPSLTSVEVDPANPVFYLDGSLLLERLPKGTSQVLHFLDDREVVIIPEEVSRIAPYAFAGTTSMRELRISDRVRRIGTDAFNVADIVTHVHIDVVRRPIEGHPSFDLNFPPTRRSLHEFKMALGMSTRLDIERILKHYDEAIIYMSDFGNGVLREGPGSHAQYVQALSIIERMQDPVLMSDRARRLFNRTILGNISDICVAVARHDDRDAIDALLDLGYLDEESLLAAIDAVGELKDAAMTGYLLEVKRLRFGGSAIDFDL